MTWLPCKDRTGCPDVGLCPDCPGKRSAPTLVIMVDRRVAVDLDAPMERALVESGDLAGLYVLLARKLGLDSFVETVDSVELQ